MYNSVSNPLAITFFKSVIIFSRVIILFLIVAIDYVEEKDYLLQREREAGHIAADKNSSSFDFSLHSRFISRLKQFSIKKNASKDSRIGMQTFQYRILSTIFNKECASGEEFLCP